ncbi:ABC transporter ATP-binding protein [Zavarzinia sp. CC-PAN008]|uniref:ABC transporter ATP-binding protein n=1 Tax=Zavarzinia sp. CC-PAN008 TaxID=3243332 RepID=UPI003F743D62
MPSTRARPGLEMTLVSVRDLKVAFQVEGGLVEAVRGVSFDVAAGETVAIVGESGSGKSVTALSILQLLAAPPARYGGSITVDGHQVIGADSRALQAIRGNRIGMVFQEPMTSLNPLHTVRRQIAEALALHKGLVGAAADAQVLELLRLVGIPQPESRLNSYPHQLSGGQRQRVMIAMALAGEPDLLIADEPTTALDVTVQAQILALLKDLQRRLGMALLLITHDLGIVRRMANRVLVMTRGQIVEDGPADRIFAAPEHPYTQALLAAEPKGRPNRGPADAAEIMAGEDVKVHFPIRAGVFRRQVGAVKAVDGISLTLKAGHTLGVVGESGSGKTTLGLALLRLLPSTGRIRFEGQPIEALEGRALRRLRPRMQIVFQDPFASLNPRMLVGDIVAEGLDAHDPVKGADARRARVAAALEEVGLPGEAQDRYPHEFSGGQRQRIAIARAMILKPRFVVLDEPTSALDMSVQAQIVDLLRDLQQKHGLAYMFISHDLKVVRALADELIVMKDGLAVEQGPAEQVFANPQQPYTRALMAAAFDLHPVDVGAVAQ